jgi:hypothetical protein
MSDDLEPDYIEQTGLTDKQRAYVDAFFKNKFDKKAAFFEAGYTCSNLDRLHVRISKIHNNELVRKAIDLRRVENQAELHRFSPLDVMCQNLDYWFNRALDKTLEEGDRNRARAEAQAVAVQAAPYVHPRLQAIALKTIAEKDLNDYTDDELDITIARIEQALQIAGPVETGEGSAGKKAH